MSAPALGRPDSAIRPVRVFLLDDHHIVRHGLSTLLGAEPMMEVVGEAGTVGEALELLAGVRPDVAILDVRLPDGSGVEVCRELRSKYPEVACLMLTSFSDDEALLDAVMAGAAGYILKEVGTMELVANVRRVASGHSLLDRRLVTSVMDRVRGRAQDPAQDQLTAREERILGHIAEGLTNRQIAALTYLSEKTVKNYVTSLLGKLGLSRRTEAAIYAIRRAEALSLHQSN